MNIYADPRGRKFTDEQIAREWIRRHPEQAAKLADAARPHRYPDAFGLEVEQHQDGSVTLWPE